MKIMVYHEDYGLSAQYWEYFLDWSYDIQLGDQRPFKVLATLNSFSNLKDLLFKCCKQTQRLLTDPCFFLAICSSCIFERRVLIMNDRKVLETGRHYRWINEPIYTHILIINIGSMLVLCLLSTFFHNLFSSLS